MARIYRLFALAVRSVGRDAAGVGFNRYVVVASTITRIGHDVGHPCIVCSQVGSEVRGKAERASESAPSRITVPKRRPPAALDFATCLPSHETSTSLINRVVFPYHCRLLYYG